MLFAITENHWVMALDDLALLSCSNYFCPWKGLVTWCIEWLSSLLPLHQVPCGCQGYGFQLTLHASIPGRQDPVPAGGLHVPGGRQSFCTYYEWNLIGFLFLSTSVFVISYLWCLLQIYITCILKATLASAPSDALRKSCSFANGYVHAT